MTPYYFEMEIFQRQRDTERAAERRRLIKDAKRPRESGAAAFSAGFSQASPSTPSGAPSSSPSPAPAPTPSAKRPRLALVVAALGVLYLVWGSTYLGIRVAIDTIPPLLMASVRFALAGIVLYFWAVRQGDTRGDRPGRRQWVATAVVGVLLLAGGNGGVTWAEQFVPTGVAALLIASVPIWIVVFAHFTGDDRITWPVAVGLAVGIVGVAILVQPGADSGKHLAGSLVLLAAAFAWAAGSVYARRAPLPRRPLVATGMEMIGGSVALLVLAAVTGELSRVHPERISWQSVVALLYLTVFGSLLAFSSYVWLLRHTRAAVAGTYAFVNPAVAVVLGWAFLGEALTTRVLAAGAVIILAVVVVMSAPALRRPSSWRPRRSRSRRTPETGPESAPAG
jgi:drug/metabolite transporter (DMT)-like permease